MDDKYIEKQPEFKKCTKQEILYEDDNIIVFGIVHPQWGGYCSAATVEFHKQTGSGEGGSGCFELTNWHDGEFPISEDNGRLPREPFKVHCCSAEQFVDFGLSILEKMKEHQKHGDSHINIDEGWIERSISRLNGLLNKLNGLLNKPTFESMSSIAYMIEDWKHNKG
jgi:hypothetical protein